MKFQPVGSVTLFAFLCLHQIHFANAAEASATITKEAAKAQLIKSMESLGFRADPASKEFTECLMFAQLDEVFPTGVSELYADVFSKRWRAVPGTKSFQIRSQQCVEQTAKQASGTMDIDDLRTDFASLNGRKVAVRAEGSYVMNAFMIRKDSTDMSPILVDISKIPRDQRQAVIKSCNTLGGCAVTVRGTVGKVNFLDGIVAESVGTR